MSLSRSVRVLRLGALAVAVAALLGPVGVAESFSASPASGPLIEFWDGTSWQQQVGPNPNGTGRFGAVTAVSATDVWAVGKYYADHRERALAAHWDGSSWKQVAMPQPRWASRLDFHAADAISTRNVWVVGTLIEHWNGRAWRVVPRPPLVRSHLADVAAVSPGNVWVVGDYAPETGTRHRTLVLHWNGKKWKHIPSPHPGTPAFGSRLSGVTAVSANSVWAVGSYSRALYGNRFSQTLFLHWNGKEWKHVRAYGGFDALYDVAAVGRNNVWAVGWERQNVFGSKLPLVEHWNGHNWAYRRALPTACPNASKNELTGLAPLARHDIWAAGSYWSPNPCVGGGDTINMTLAEHWDGTAWSVSPSLNPGSMDNHFLGIAAATRHAVWAVGHYSS